MKNVAKRYSGIRYFTKLQQCLHRINVRWNNPRGFDLALKPLETPVRAKTDSRRNSISINFLQSSNKVQIDIYIWFSFGF